MNARDAVADHEGIVSLTLERATRRASFPFGDLPAIDHDWVHLTVRDTGAGMDGETLRQIFEPFFTTKRGGTGLGLPIAQKMISANDGILFVESTPGMGTAFHVFVPGAENSAARGGAAVTDQGDLPSRILLVEDDEAVALGLIAGLQYEGVEVRLVGTGEAAIEALAERPEAMILDVGLPDMDGTAVCEVALERWPDLPIVFSTGHGDASRLGRFLERPNVRFLMKPYSFEQLREAIVAVRKSD
jgi:two-component system cell cycle sensor histidine kinase/response regulator CckA